MSAFRPPMRILLVGGGGREHALAWRLANEEGVETVIAVPGSDGIAALPRVRVDPAVRPTDPTEVVTAARRAAADLVVVGPEAPLAAGVADALLAAGFAVFGPPAAAARIESSKAFCHEVAAAAGIPMARAAAFAALAPARSFARELAASGGGVVVKADGLAAGKGVTVCDTVEEADGALAAIFAEADGPVGAARLVSAADAPAPGTDGVPLVVVEERLRGPEASVIALCDGRDALALPAARDHKRLGDGDTGPNTGGMGAYSPVPDLPDGLVAQAVERFHLPALVELARRRTPFRGALYAGLILTRDRGPVLLEFNARFGDPEAQAILPRVAVPLAPLLLAAAEGRLGTAARRARRRGPPRAGLPRGGSRDRPRESPLPGSAGDRGPHRRPGRSHGRRGARLPRWDPEGKRGDLGDGRRAGARRGRRRGRPPRRPVRGGGGGERDRVRGCSPPPRHRGRGPGRGPRMIPRYTRPEMGAAWSDEARFGAMLRVELAVAGAQAARGMVPASAYEAMVERAQVDVARIAEIEQTTDHDVIAFVSQVAESVGPEGRYLHLGLTSSDVVDTGLALQLRAAGDLLLRESRPSPRLRSSPARGARPAR